MSIASESAQQGAALASSGESLMGLAVLGKTALALGLVVGCIFLCSWLLRRIGPARRWSGQQVQVVSATQIGQKERVVIVEVQGQWLVLGVTAQQVSLLSELPAPPAAEPAPATGAAVGPLFAERLASALKTRLKPSPSQPSANA
jgi:flagellar protein FliO/FliZ